MKNKFYKLFLPMLLVSSFGAIKADELFMIEDANPVSENLEISADELALSNESYNPLIYQMFFSKLVVASEVLGLSKLAKWASFKLEEGPSKQDQQIFALGVLGLGAYLTSVVSSMYPDNKYLPIAIATAMISLGLFGLGDPSAQTRSGK